MGIFGGGADRQEYLALENRVARLEEQVARLLAAAVAAPSGPGPGGAAPGGATPGGPGPAGTGPAGAAAALTPVVPAAVSAPAPSSAPLDGLTPEALEEARRLKHDGKAIHAIKIVRERTGWSLRDAKDYVDEL